MHYAISDWTATGERGVYIDYDIETYPLQIMTDSVVGSEDLVWVQFYTDDGSDSVGIDVKFTDPPQYDIGYCTGWITFTVPEEQVRTWPITKTATSLIFACNGVEIYNYLFSESTDNQCLPQWSKDAAKIYFTSSDTASEEYRTQPSGKWIFSTASIIIY